MTPEDLLVKQKIPYTPKGADLEVRCFNPEHADRNPSTRVDKITGVFHCLSCGFKGNVFTFFGQKPNFLQMKRLELRSKVVLKMAENVGLDIPKDAVPYEGSWRGISNETYKKFGAFISSEKDHVGRIVFPIKGISGKINGFNGRHTVSGHSPKYMISPPGAKFPLFPGNVEPIQGQVILVEGIFDMLNLHDKGLTNSVCAFGTQKLKGAAGREKLQLLKFQGVSGIDIFFDPDDAGQAAVDTVIELCNSVELTHRVIRHSSDPGDLTKEQVINLKEKLYG